MKLKIRVLDISIGIFGIGCVIFLERLVYGIGSSDVNSAQAFILLIATAFLCGVRFINYETYNWDGKRNDR